MSVKCDRLGNICGLVGGKRREPMTDDSWSGWWNQQIRDLEITCEMGKTEVLRMQVDNLQLEIKSLQVEDARNKDTSNGG